MRASLLTNNFQPGHIFLLTYFTSWLLMSAFSSHLTTYFGSEMASLNRLRLSLIANVVKITSSSSGKCPTDELTIWNFQTNTYVWSKERMQVCRDVLKTVTAAELLNKFHIFYRTPRMFFMHIRPPPPPSASLLPHAIWNQSKPSHVRKCIWRSKDLSHSIWWKMRMRSEFHYVEGQYKEMFASVYAADVLWASNTT